MVKLTGLNCCWKELFHLIFMILGSFDILACIYRLGKEHRIILPIFLIHSRILASVSRKELIRYLLSVRTEQDLMEDLSFSIKYQSSSRNDLILITGVFLNKQTNKETSSGSTETWLSFPQELMSGSTWEKVSSTWDIKRTCITAQPADSWP